MYKNSVLYLYFSDFNFFLVTALFIVVFLCTLHNIWYLHYMHISLHDMVSSQLFGLLKDFVPSNSKMRRFCIYAYCLVYIRKTVTVYYIHIHDALHSWPHMSPVVVGVAAQSPSSFFRIQYVCNLKIKKKINK